MNANQPLFLLGGARSWLSIARGGSQKVDGFLGKDVYQSDAFGQSWFGVFWLCFELLTNTKRPFEGFVCVCWKNVFWASGRHIQAKNSCHGQSHGPASPSASRC